MKTIEELTKNKSEHEDEFLWRLFSMGQITLEEFLEFSGLSFAPKLLESVKKRKTILQTDESSQQQLPVQVPFAPKLLESVKKRKTILQTDESSQQQLKPELGRDSSQVVRQNPLSSQ